MAEFISAHWLDIITTILGLIYIWLEYKASIALWIVGIIMPALDVYLYWSHGLYGDAGMAVYYTLAAVYGYIAWKWYGHKHKNAKSNNEGKHELPITHIRTRHILPATAAFFIAWGLTYWVLVTFTNSTVPLLDAFTNALSFIGLWALAKKYIEQWLFWIVVDAVCAYLYIDKDIPFKASLYALYVVIAVMGYYKWKQMMAQQNTGKQKETKAINQ